MNEQHKKNFTLELKDLLSAQSLASLRTIGRSIGLTSPTILKKGELIDEIIGVIVGDIPTQARSGRGAPVLNNSPDARILEEIERIKAKYSDHVLTPRDLEKIDYHLKERLDELRKEKNAFVLRSPERFEFNEDGTPRVFKGQLATHKGVSFLLPLDYVNDQEKMLLAVEFIRKYGLKEGDVIACNAKREGEIAVVTRIVEINGMSPEFFQRGTNFEDANVRYPVGRILVYDKERSPWLTAKYMDWVVPFGRGNRGLIIAPPKTGKTYFLEKVAAGAARLNDDVITLVLLVDQSPETIAQFRKIIAKDALIYSTYEDEPERQVFVADSILKRAKRLAECGRDVLLIVDSFNALAHAYNDTEQSSGGKMLPCGLESKTINYIKKYFGSARCLAEGGSLTILGSVSNATGNPADEVIASEVSSASNLEIRLNEELAIKRIFPAVDKNSVYVKFNDAEGYSEPEALALLRRTCATHFNGVEMLSELEKTATQQEFLEYLRKM